MGPGGQRSIFAFLLFFMEENGGYQVIFSEWKLFLLAYNPKNFPIIFARFGGRVRTTPIFGSNQSWGFLKKLLASSSWWWLKNSEFLQACRVTLSGVAVWRNTGLSLEDTWETVWRQLGDKRRRVHANYLISSSLAKISKQALVPNQTATMVYKGSSDILWQM